LELYLGGLNRNHLLNLLLEAERVIDGARRTEEVWAAVAYATGVKGNGALISHCFEKGIPLKFWGRLDDQVAVDVGILNLFLQRSSPDYVCKLVPKHHAKVIWWRGFGVYIGSANLTYSAWNLNVEAGCFFEEEELTIGQVDDLERMFEKLDSKGSPLTEELRDLMIARAKKIETQTASDPTFWQHPSVTSWGGLITREPKPSADKRRDGFLQEWNETLQYLRAIAARVSQPSYRPHWIAEGASPGAQADQFLHAHYYNNTFDGQQAAYERHFNDNKARKEAALMDAMEWWARLPCPPSKKYDEETTVNIVAPMMVELLAEDRILLLTKDEFRQNIVANVHSIMEYARRVRNVAVGLSEGQSYNLEEKQDALANFLWTQRNQSGQSVIQSLHEVLYGGADDLVPQRLWSAISDPKKKIGRFGVSALGETIGWANPDRFPPRNGRTSKALRSLGYDVKVHVD
jgi:PLD-like domain